MALNGLQLEINAVVIWRYIIDAKNLVIWDIFEIYTVEKYQTLINKNKTTSPSKLKKYETQYCYYWRGLGWTNCRSYTLKIRKEGDIARTTPQTRWVRHHI